MAESLTYQFKHTIVGVRCFREDAGLAVVTMLQGLFTTAIGRSVPVLYQKIVRRGKVEAAMRGDTQQNKAIRQALTDYEVIIGSTYGQLTGTLEKFLRQLAHLIHRMAGIRWRM